MLMQRDTSFTDVAIVSIKGSDYRIYFWYMSKDDVINIMNNSNLNKKGPCCNFLFYYYYVKMSQNTYQRNRDMILNRAKDYYGNEKRKIKRGSVSYKQKFTFRRQKWKIEYVRNRFFNMSEEKKQKLKEYQKNIMKPKKVKRLDFVILCFLVIHY